MSDTKNTNTFIHTYKRKEYVIQRVNGGKPYVLGRVTERLTNKPEDENSKDIVKLGWHNPKTGVYVRFEEISEELKKDILKI
jgi:hypothetical protein